MTNAPTAVQFKARYPEFAPVSDALIDAVIVDAVAAVGDTWVEKDVTPARLLFVAAVLLDEGEPMRSASLSGSPAGQATIIASGVIQRVKVGDVETTFNVAKPADNSGDGGPSWQSNRYGKRYLELIKRNFFGPVAL